MRKLITNLMDYKDYRLLLNDDFIKRSTTNQSYSLRAFSRDLGISPSYLCQVMRGSRVPSLNSILKIFTILGFQGSDLTYIEKLFHSRHSKSLSERLEATAYVENHYNEIGYREVPGRFGFLKSLEHFLVYGLLRKVQNDELINVWCKLLEVSQSRKDEVLHDLEEDGFILKKNNFYEVLDDKIVAHAGERVVDVAGDLIEKLFKQIKYNGGIKVPEQVIHGLVLCLDQEAFPLAMAAHKHFIQTLHRLGQQSKKVDHVLLWGDIFRALSLQGHLQTPANTFHV